MADTHFLFLLILAKPVTQIFGAQWIFALGHIFTELESFVHNADTNFSFPLTLRNQRPKLWGVPNWKFCSRSHFCRTRAIFSIMADTNLSFLFTLCKLDTQTLGEGLVIESSVSAFKQDNVSKLKTCIYVYIHTSLYLKVHNGWSEFSIGSVFPVPMPLYSRFSIQVWLHLKYLESSVDTIAWWPFCIEKYLKADANFSVGSVPHHHTIVTWLQCQHLGMAKTFMYGHLCIMAFRHFILKSVEINSTRTTHRIFKHNHGKLLNCSSHH